jgi:t-SNARE complex subunit (syntaxin)
MQSTTIGSSSPYAILDGCRQVDKDLDILDTQLENLRLVLSKMSLRPDMGSSEISQLKLSIQDSYRAIVYNISNLRSTPEADSKQNAIHVRKVVNRLKTTIQHYETLLAGFRRDSEQIAKRHFRIVHPDATDAEAVEAASNPDMPIFQQAVSNKLFYNSLR